MAAKLGRSYSIRMSASDKEIRSPERLAELARRILRHATRGLPRMDFLREASKMLLEFSACDALELRLKDSHVEYRCEGSKRPKPAFRFAILRDRGKKSRRVAAAEPHQGPTLERVCQEILRGCFEGARAFFSTRRGNYWTGDTHKAVQLRRVKGAPLGGMYRSIALIRFTVDDGTTGLLQLKVLQPNHFTQAQVESFEGIAQTLGLAIANQRVQWALRERVKELTCLYGIAQVAQRPGLTLEETLKGIVGLLPPAWQHPEIATARILLDGRACTTSDFQEGPHRQAAEILVGGARRGVVEVFYTRDKAGFVEGPFLKEEQSLIDTVAREVSLVVERREAEIHKTKLQDQLRHADRLATIGQLAAGVAHELNEPLATILGFAQLATKEKGMPATAAGDLGKIVKTSLQAREIIHKLLVFSRQMPLQKVRVNLNQVIEEGLHFFESRCTKAGIELVRSLDPKLPKISGDPSQLQQVLVNLVVNAIQACPGGGRLTIETQRGRDYVSLAVTDTGTGMADEVKSKIFTPFFTTKDVDEGTGLGLAVVHGIVSSHRGVIHVESEVGRGSRFEVQLPVNDSEKPAKECGEGLHGSARTNLGR